jgi:phosphotransferase system  glucose/maltose/N-acetylglucosamine-specific IIC component
MLWVGWRQQRTETVVAAALLALLAALLIPTGLHILAAYDDAHLADCLGRTQAGSCPDVIGAFVNRFNHLGDLLAWLTLLPGVIGLLLAAPLVSQLEHNTHRLDWTQSITRRRWLAGKLGLALATAVAAAVVMTLLITWWRAPMAHFQGRVSNSTYDSEGTVVAAYAVFALGLAAAIGAVWRRAVPSFVAAFAGYFGVRVFFDEVVRQHLVKPVSATFAFKRGGPDLNTAWILQQTPVGPNGKPLEFLSCPHNAGGPCELRAPGLSAMHVVYHPASHFWALQIRETALFGVAGLALLAFAAWWTARA